MKCYRIGNVFIQDSTKNISLVSLIGNFIFAFWDKIDGKQTLVLDTHGLIKKTGKTPLSELDKAERIRQQYFD
jgi:phage-related protein